MKRITIVLFLCFMGITMITAQQKTFKGTWLYEQGEKSGTIQLDLYQKSVENGFDMNGALCYGTFAFSDGSYYSIEEVKVEGNNALLQKVFDTEMGEFRMQMTYNSTNQSIELNTNGANGLPDKLLLRKSDIQNQETSAESPIINEVDNETSSPINWTGIVGAMILIVIMIGYSLFIINKKSEFDQVYTSEYFSTIRRSNGKDSQSSPAEDAQAKGLLDKLRQELTVFQNHPNDASYLVVLKKKQYKKCADYLRQAIDVASTHPEVISDLQRYAHILTNSQRRLFDGSYSVMVAAGIATLLVGYLMSDILIAILFAGAIAVYYFASFAPQYLILNKVANCSHAPTGFLGTLAQIVGNAKVITYIFDTQDPIDTITGDNKYRYDDYSQVQASVFIVILAYLLTGIGIMYIACWRFFRNFIMH
ncbi:hypothetical protein [uncultured Bacteroides sp.]|uniref:hypothetical protein n=1 Tax=uncultured Bacteroides sp. TaxID=162156 RepID=UPI0025F1FB97|nr:hypothetical protein [uncultured Bacteroides sp.]